jgi:hypothetical protein
MFQGLHVDDVGGSNVLIAKDKDGCGALEDVLRIPESKPRGKFRERQAKAGFDSFRILLGDGTKNIAL